MAETTENLNEKNTSDAAAWESQNAKALDEVLASIEEASKVGENVVQRDKGTRFETVICEWLKRDSTYRDLFSEVLTYAEWAKVNSQVAVNARDTGIDLVAKNADGSGFTAVQCKFWSKEKSVSKKEIDSFIVASEHPVFTARLVVATNDKWSPNAEKAWVQTGKPFTFITRQTLAKSDVDWSKFLKSGTMKTFAKRTPFDFQKEAIAAVIKGFAEHDRGKLIMACGTGKTFTSLKIAEQQAGAGTLVAFVVPSLALLSQTLTDWKQQCTVPIRAFAVCSDAEIGKSDATELDTLMRPSELAYPATTNAESLKKQIGDAVDPKVMTVIFSTYQSIAVVSDAQKAGLRALDLVICDEAHRTASGFLRTEKDKETDFTRIHDENFLHAKKRLYMTATPRIYGKAAKKQEEDGDAILYSMDDEKVFGPDFYTVSFSRAVSLGRLVDYKVIVLGIDPSVIGAMKNYRGIVPGEIEKAQQNESNVPINLLAKILGSWHALAKRGLKDEVSVADDLSAMKRAVGFAQVIDYTLPKSGTPTKEELDRASKVSSKFLAEYFGGVVDAFKTALKKKLQDEGRYEEGAFNEQYALVCDTQHVDGSMGAQEKGAKLDWLRAEPEKDHCKILFNVRCLSEGVDVPALDAVMFLTPRESEVDVVQTVGRVMRVAPGKKRGYVIIPVLIPEGVDAHDALDKVKDFKTVWQVLRALRSIDSHFASVVDGQLQKVNSDKIEVRCITNEEKGIKAKGSKNGSKVSRHHGKKPSPHNPQLEIDFSRDEIWEQEIKARIVKRVGNRHEWGDWAEEVSYLCQKQIENIETLVQTKAQSREQFGKFREEINATLNGNLDDHGICEMLGQHVVISPALDALFTAEFTKNNPIAKAMTRMCEALDREGMEKVNKDLQPFYADVKMRAANVKTTADRQTVILELFDKFFKAAFPKMQEKLGIVYTPVEIVDFINQSVEDLMKKEFGKSLADEGVHILDPFTGTGTFMTRLMQSGIIPKDRLPFKYEQEMHANEIVPLAYYIASMNLESVYQEQTGAAEYKPNDVMVWTDTFASDDKSDLVQNILNENNLRLKRQLNNPIRVIIGNPPYSVGQDSQNDNNANDKYPTVDLRLAETYVGNSSAGLKNSLYDSYIRAYRWATDKIGDKGIIGFVTNAGWIDSNSADGMRKCMAEEFNSIYVYHLKGNCRTQGEQRRKEKENVFGEGSRAPVAIVLLVKNPADPEKGKIHFHAVDDYLTREEKLAQVTVSRSVVSMDWTRITPDAHGDWLNQRDDSFSGYLAMGSASNTENAIFKLVTWGAKSNRDAWVVNSSSKAIETALGVFVRTYENALSLAKEGHTIADIRNQVSRGISWTRNLLKTLQKKEEINVSSKCLRRALYRPFNRQYFYYDTTRRFTEEPGKWGAILPYEMAKNFAICVAGIGAKEFSCLMTDCIADLQLNFNGQCFPRWIYTENSPKGKKSATGDLFVAADATDAPGGYTKTDAITDEALTHFQAAYPGESITKDDIFYYIYGVLHSEDYRARYANNLMKELPRIPRVATFEQFKAFTDAGRKLADLHVNFESVDEYTGVKISQRNPNAQDKYRVTKMQYGKIPGKTGNAAKDKTVIQYNDNITITGIPLEAQEYVVNKRSALDWILEKARVSQDKDSGIVNDFNDYGMEMTPPNPRYPLSLVLRIITVSLKTMEIVKALPKLEIHPLDQAK